MNRLRPRRCNRTAVPSSASARAASRAELAAHASRWTQPPGDNLAEYLKQLTTLEPGHEAIARLRKKAAEVLLPRGTKELADKHAHEAADSLRELRMVGPENKDAVAPFTEAVITESKILRHMQTWDEILPLSEELARINPKNFDGHMLRGQALAGLGRWADAAASYKTASDLKPKDKAAKAALAEAKKKAGGK